MRRACKAFSIVVFCSLLLVLLYCLLADEEHVEPSSVNIEPNYDDPQITKSFDTEQRNLHIENQPSSSLKTLRTRVNHLTKECKGLGHDGPEFRNLSKTQLSHIIVDDKHKVLYCFVPKVACTNLKKLFLLLSGKSNVTDSIYTNAKGFHVKLANQLTYLPLLAPEEIAYRLQNYKKAIFVREPLERLLSAYKNKFLEKGNVYFKQVYGRRIIEMFRENPSKKSLQFGLDLKFSEFIDYLLHPNTTIEGFNDHWNSYYNLCSPCHIQYDFIGHYETLNEDVDLLLKEISAEGIRFPERSVQYKSTKTKDVMREFYGDIDPEKIRKLLELYSFDYSIFGFQSPTLNDDV